MGSAILGARRLTAAAICVAATVTFVAVEASRSGATETAAPAAVKKKPAGKRKPAAKKPGAKGKRKPPRGKGKRPGAKRPKVPRPPKKPRKLKTPPRSFFGIQSFEPLSNGELNAVRRARIGAQRIVMRWPLVERVPGGRDWSFYDSQFARAALFGVRIIPALYGSPPHVAQISTQPPLTATARAGWSAFVADATRRYGHGGSFWKANPGLPYFPVRNWQVWNEPSSLTYWQSGPNAAQYVGLLRDTRAAVRAVDRRGRIMLGGLLFHRRDPTGIPMKRFLKQIYAIPGSRDTFDVVALHPYTLHPFKVLEILEKARKVMVRRRDARTPIWITELGWSTGGVGGRAGDVTSLAEQARRLRKTYTLLKRNRGVLKLKGVIWYVLRDFQLAANYWHLHMGLFNANKTAKPSWPAFAAVTGGEAAGIFDPPQTTPPPPPPPPPPENEPAPRPCFLLIFC